MGEKRKINEYTGTIFKANPDTILNEKLLIESNTLYNTITTEKEYLPPQTNSTTFSSDKPVIILIDKLGARQWDHWT